jgi:hypothetical protein
MLGLFPKRRGLAIRRYREFVDGRLRERSPLENAIGSILGDEGFTTSILWLFGEYFFPIHSIFHYKEDWSGQPETES